LGTILAKTVLLGTGLLGAYFAGLAGGLSAGGGSWSELFRVILLGYVLVSVGFGLAVVGLVAALQDRIGRLLSLAAFAANVARGPRPLARLLPES
jgi:hypothetical protein